MLQLKNIKKSYTTAGFTQNALDGVSVAFRDNEFAAVLGPSGSGKTTMLNIIGGLDRYDSGDLEIDGISTKNYKESDWDTYRNNRIGFVFQSYNLIPHQSVLANVELALTLSGVSIGERRKRAKEALEEVGLGDHIHKKPNQLSGGQMQRVAIARAIINDPEILMADEPTGALDSTTSLQVMELLTKIAENRCVIMVTHNNELAEKYANRLVHLKDGKVISDSRPFDPAKEKQREPAPPRRSRMSFFTAVALSFSNLMTKKGRTFTTAFAGSIGIIGVAVILAFSNGINAYISSIEEDTLSVYPLSITQQSFDMSGFFGSDGDEGDSGERRRAERPPGTIREIRVMERAFSTQSLNDLAALKKHIEENPDKIEPYVNTIQYTYDITPQVYLPDTSGGADRIFPDSILAPLTGGQSMSSMPMGGMTLPGMPSMDIFYSLPNEPDLYRSQYEIIDGRWPESFDEAVLVLNYDRNVLDFTLYSLGIRDREEMREMLDSFMTGTETEMVFAESAGFYPYDALMDLSFKVVLPAEMYQYDEIYEIWVDKSGDDDFMEQLIASSLDLTIVGIVQPEQDASSTVLSPGVNYTPELIYYLIDATKEIPIVRDQLARPEVNVISGNTFEYEEENPPNTFDFSRIISVDEDTFTEAMGLEGLLDGLDFEGVDLSNLDLSGFDMSGIDLSGLDFGNIDMGAMDFGDMLGNIDMTQVPAPNIDIGALVDVIAAQVDIPPSAVNGIINYIVAGLLPEITAALPGIMMNPDADPADAVTSIIEGYFERPEVQSGIMAEISKYVDMTALEGQISNAVTTFIMASVNEYMTSMLGMIEAQIASAMESVMKQIERGIRDAMSDMSTQMTRAMRRMTRQIEDAITEVFEDMMAEMESAMEGFDPDALAEAFQLEMNEEAILELMTAMMNPTITSYERNLSLFGYADTDKPTQISFYPRSFEAKEEVLAFLDRYNADMERTGQEDKVVHFVDIVGLMMSSVTNIIDIVSYALIAFVSVALVVSSIMIGVITFVSVLERKKEIGILRAVGASRGNIRLVFNAETLIIGFTAGLIGVIVTYFISIIANAILYDLLAVRNLVLILPYVPFMLIAISMFLTFIAGLIPASAAASKPPVEALRSE